MKRTNTYTIDIVVKDDKTRQYIGELEGKLSDLNKAAKNSIKTGDFDKGLKDAEKIADDLIKSLNEGAKDSSIAFADVFKSYQANSKRAIDMLARQYDVLNAKKKDVLNAQKEIGDLEAQRAKTNEAEKQAEIDARIAQIKEKIKGLDIDSIDAQIAKNRKIRANLKEAETEAVYRQKANKAEAALAKYRELQKKQKKAQNADDKKALDDQLKKQKLYIQSIIAAKKALKENTNEIEKELAKTTLLQRARKAVETVTQSRAGKAVIGAGKAVGAAVMGVAGAGLALAGQAVDASQREVDLEAAINRINGIGGDDAKKHDIIKEIYYQTGADYGVIVEAINKVRKAMGRGASDSDVAEGAIIEVKYPGMSQAFASTNTQYNVQNARIFASRQKEIQKATGASNEQLQAASEIVANLKPQNFKSATGTDLQTIYLGLQNSGAFDSQEELDTAFKRFMADQSQSGKNIFDFAQDYTDQGKWSERIYDARNKLQADNTINNIDFSSLRKASETTDTATGEPSAAMKVLIDSRKLEDMKNELLIKLIPAIQPVVTELSKLAENKLINDVLNGLIEILKSVPTLIIPAFDGLQKMLDYLDVHVRPVLMPLLSKMMAFFENTEFLEKAAKAAQVAVNPFGALAELLPQNAAGGIATMPSIVGERGPEAIIPLDNSRSQRAENIINNISQNFSLKGTETTALSLANAVKSRNFTRAINDSAYIKRKSL